MPTSLLSARGCCCPKPMASPGGGIVVSLFPWLQQIPFFLSPLCSHTLSRSGSGFQKVHSGLRLAQGPGEPRDLRLLFATLHLLKWSPSSFPESLPEERGVTVCSENHLVEPGDSYSPNRSWPHQPLIRQSPRSRVQSPEDSRSPEAWKDLGRGAWRSRGGAEPGGERQGTLQWA